MSQESDFDPYYKWLGIRPEHQPPDHYRLLGLDRYEADREVIRAATERQMAHVQRYKIGPQSELSQRLLNEIAKCKVCLLDAASKATYDRTLRPHFTDVFSAPREDAGIPVGISPPIASPLPGVVAAPHATSMPNVPSGIGGSYSGIRVRTAYHRKRTPTTGVAVAICFVGFLILGIGIVLLTDTQALIGQFKPTDKGPVRDQPQPKPKLNAPPTLEPKSQPMPKPKASPTPEPKSQPIPKPKAPPTPEPNSQPTPPLAASDGKLAVPTAKQIEEAQAAIQIEGQLSPLELLEAADDSKHPWMQYVLYRMAIDAAVAEANTRIALRAVEAMIEHYDLDAKALRDDVSKKLRSESPPPILSLKPKSKQQPPASDDGRETTSGSTVQLPERQKTDPVVIADVAEGEAEIDVVNAAGNPLNFRVVVDEPQRRWTVTDGTRNIAHASRNDGILELSWSPNAPADAECLRNVMLRITLGPETKLIKLRPPGVADAPLIDLSNSVSTVPIDVPLWNLDYKSLKIEATGLLDDNPHVDAFDPSTRKVDFGDELTVIVRDRPPSAGIQFSLRAKDGRLSIRIEPLIVAFKNRPQPWTLDRLTGLNKALVRLIAKQERDIPRVRIDISNLEKQLRYLRSQYNPNSASASFIASKINNVASDLQKAKDNLATMETALPINKAGLEALEPLGPLSSEIHQKARLTFRVFYLVGDEEIDVVRAERIGSPQDRSAGL